MTSSNEENVQVLGVGKDSKLRASVQTPGRGICSDVVHPVHCSGSLASHVVYSTDSMWLVPVPREIKGLVRGRLAGLSTDPTVLAGPQAIGGTHHLPPLPAFQIFSHLDWILTDAYFFPVGMTQIFLTERSEG